MPDPREIYFHEDDYCQQQLLPAANFEHSQAELRAISDFARAHEAPGGAGWSDCFVRREAPVPLSSLKIMRHELETAMREVMPAYDVIYSGYSSHRQKCVRTAGWGRSDNCTLFADWDDREVVADIWTMFFEPDEGSDPRRRPGGRRRRQASANHLRRLGVGFRPAKRMTKRSSPMNFAPSSRESTDASTSQSAIDPSICWTVRE